MRWSEIAHRLDERTAHGSNPAFKAWFGASVVTDAHANPMVVYHGTRRSFDEFWPGSHFGDAEAANVRLNNLAADPPRFSGHHGQIMPVYLAISNPLRVIDDRCLDNGYDLAKAARRAGAISEPEYLAIVDTVSPTIAKRRLFTGLTAKGYDGLVYRNVVEGQADSWVPFRPEQVKSVYAREFNPHSAKFNEEG